MSFQAMTWAVEQELPAMQKIVLLMMANRTSNDNGLCFPSHEKLAKDCGMEKRSVIRQIEKLETAGLLTVIRSVDDKGMKAVNKYRLHLDVKAAPTCHKVTTVVTESHQGSDTKSLGGSDTKSHKTVNSFNQSINQSIKQERDAPKPEPVLVEKVAKEKPIKFTPPTLEEVIAYCMAECLNMNAETFFYFYAQKDWMVGKNKMKSWTMAAKGWATRQKDFVQPTNKARIVKPDFTNPIKYSLDDDFGDVNAIDSFVVPAMQFAQIGGRL